MTFKEATDDLLVCFSHEELAAALGCSVATVRQARLLPHALARRKAPVGWEEKVAKLAHRRGLQFLKLAEKLNP